MVDPALLAQWLAWTVVEQRWRRIALRLLHTSHAGDAQGDAKAGAKTDAKNGTISPAREHAALAAGGKPSTWLEDFLFYNENHTKPN